jgi:NAD-dependent SIR2 family protein deacetylase
LKHQAEINDIKKAINHHKLVVFIGAGFSKNYGLPDLNELTKRFAENINYKSQKQKEFSKFRDSILKKIQKENEKKQDILKIQENIIEDFTNFFEKNQFSTDDYLEIAQYYFNEKKERLYFQLLKDSLKPTKKSKLAKYLFDLEPSHIITTNFDNILETENKQYLSFKRYDVIRKNEDLAQSNKSSFIIKMHGDIDKKNIVLKDEDYLQYQENFKLIDVFVKSLFATNTVIFIGFATDDPNFKKIFSWVQNILKNESRNTYYIDVSDVELNQLKVNYMKQRNIFYLHYNTFEFEEIKGKNRHEKRLIAIFKELKKIDYAERDFLTSLYRDLYPFRLLNIMLPEHIRSIKNRYQDKDLISSSNSSFIIKDKEFINYIENFESLDNSIRNKVEFIFKILAKAGIIEIKKYPEIVSGYCNPIQIKDISNYDRTNSLDDFFLTLSDFDYSKLSEMLSSYLSNEELKKNCNELMFLKKAYYLHKIGENIEAYKFYELISNFAYKNEIYDLYLLSEFNRKNICLILYFKENEKEYFQLYNKIDIDTEFNKFSLQDQKKYLHFYDLLKNSFYSFNLNYDISSKVEKIEKHTANIEKGTYFWIGGNDYEYLRNEISKFCLFINENYLVIDFNEDIKRIFTSYLKGLCCSYSGDYEYSDKKPKVTDFNYNDFFNIVYYVDHKVVTEIFEKFSIKELKFNKKNVTDIFKSFLNLNFFINENKINLNEESYLHSKLLNSFLNFIIFFSKMDMSKKQFQSIILYCKSLYHLKFHIRQHHHLGRYITNLLRNIFDRNIILSKEVMLNFLSVVFEVIDLSNFGETLSLHKIISILMNNYKEFSFTETFNNRIKELDIDDNSNIEGFNNILILFNTADSNFKRILKEKCNKIINNYKIYDNLSSLLGIYFQIFDYNILGQSDIIAGYFETLIKLTTNKVSNINDNIIHKYSNLIYLSEKNLLTDRIIIEHLSSLRKTFKENYAKLGFVDAFIFKNEIQIEKFNPWWLFKLYGNDLRSFISVNLKYRVQLSEKIETEIAKNKSQENRKKLFKIFKIMNA